MGLPRFPARMGANAEVIGLTVRPSDRPQFTVSKPEPDLPGEALAK